MMTTRHLMVHGFTSRLAGAALGFLLATAPLASAPLAQPPNAPSVSGFGRIVPYPAATTVRDPSLAAFLADLKTIARKRDTKAFLALLPENVSIEFGIEHGRDAFAKHWKLDDPKGDFWRELEWLLGLPGDASHPDSYSVPYFSDAFPDKFHQGAELYGVIVSAREPLRATPSTSAPVIATLSYDIVTVQPWDFDPADRAAGRPAVAYDPAWERVGLADGRRGFVRREAFWSSIGTRFTLYKTDGKWAIGDYVGGD